MGKEIADVVNVELRQIDGKVFTVTKHFQLGFLVCLRLVFKFSAVQKIADFIYNCVVHLHIQLITHGKEIVEVVNVELQQIDGEFFLQ